MPVLFFVSVIQSAPGEDCVMNIVQQDGLRYNNLGYFVDIEGGGTCYSIASHLFLPAPNQVTTIQKIVLY